MSIYHAKYMEVHEENSKKKKKSPLRHTTFDPPGPRRHLTLLNQQLRRRSDLPRTLNNHPRRPRVSLLTNRGNQVLHPHEPLAKHQDRSILDNPQRLRLSHGGVGLSDDLENLGEIELLHHR